MKVKITATPTQLKKINLSYWFASGEKVEMVEDRDQAWAGIKRVGANHTPL